MTHDSNTATSNQGVVESIFEMLASDQTFLDDGTDPPDQPRTPWVLCIDDDTDYSRALKLRLDARGVGVLRAGEGMEGYRKAFSGPSDAILLDYEMPNGQGDEILRRLKENPATKAIPVIVVTGRKDPALERNMLGLGAAAFFTKPVDFAVLWRELTTHIEPRSP